MRLVIFILFYPNKQRGGGGAFFLFLFLISLIADGPHHITILSVVTKDLPISPRFTPYNFLSRCKFSTLRTRQPIMVEFYLLGAARLSFLLSLPYSADHERDWPQF